MAISKLQRYIFLMWSTDNHSYVFQAAFWHNLLFFQINTKLV